VAQRIKYEKGFTGEKETRTELANTNLQRVRVPLQQGDTGGHENGGRSVMNVLPRASVGEGGLRKKTSTQCQRSGGTKEPGY